MASDDEREEEKKIKSKWGNKLNSIKSRKFDKKKRYKKLIWLMIELKKGQMI